MERKPHSNIIPTKSCSKCQETKKFLTWSLLISVPIFLFAVYGIVIAIKNFIEYLSQ